MSNDQLLLGIVEQAIGKGKRTSGNNFAFYCPLCSHRKPKLELDFDTEFFHCWTCQPTLKGRSIVSLFKKLKISHDLIKEIKRYSKFKDVRTDKDTTQETPVLTLPKEYKPLSQSNTSIGSKHALSYLESRGITQEDILKYNIGYCDSGRYRNSIIVPTYDKNGVLTYFIARTFEKDAPRKYNAPKVNKREIVGFENFINWNVPVILCEGVFDAIAIKRNAIPLFGKSITEGLMKELVKTEVKSIYIALDKDALKDALHFSETLINLGKEVYLVELEDKDPSDIGFKGFLDLVHNAKQLTLFDLAKKRLSIL